MIEHVIIHWGNDRTVKLFTRILVISETKIIFIYSDMKISTNSLPAYSVLKPDTSSLSPSAKSNGARFVSAKILTNSIKYIYGIINIIKTPFSSNIFW